MLEKVVQDLNCIEMIKLWNGNSEEYQDEKIIRIELTLAGKQFWNQGFSILNDGGHRVYEKN